MQCNVMQFNPRFLTTGWPDGLLWIPQCMCLALACCTEQYEYSGSFAGRERGERAGKWNGWNADTDRSTEEIGTKYGEKYLGLTWLGLVTPYRRSPERAAVPCEWCIGDKSCDVM